MHISEDGRVSGSIDRAKLAQLYAETDDADLKQHYEEMAAWDGWALEQLEETATEPEPELEPEAEPEDLSGLTKAQLVERYGPGGDQMTKAQLIEALGG